MLRILPLLSLVSNVICAVAGHRHPSSHDDAYFYKGHDLSSLPILYAGGASYKDAQHHNVTRPAEDILGEGGMNTVRLRIWVNPPDGSYDLEYNIKWAKKLVKEGYRLYLDFHFSDTWADPQHQIPPAEWLNADGTQSLNVFETEIRSYVSDTLMAFHHAGIDLSLVSLGNEIRHGMLWPTGQVDVDVEPTSARIANFSSLARIYKSARTGVSDAVSRGMVKPLVMIHIDNGWNLTLQQRWFGSLTSTGIVSTSDWDVFGFSFYPFYGASATFTNLETSLNALAHRYQKPIMVVETDFPATGCVGEVYDNMAYPTFFSEPELAPHGIQGQLEWVRKITDIVKGLPNRLGQGIFYWEPAWLNLTSLDSACPDSLLFAQDWTDVKRPVGISRQSVNMFRV